MLKLISVDSPIGHKVTQFLIPAIAHLRQLYPISLKMILPVERLQLGPNSEVIDCRDLKVSDTLLDGIIYW